MKHFHILQAATNKHEVMCFDQTGHPYFCDISAAPGDHDMGYILADIGATNDVAQATICNKRGLYLCSEPSGTLLCNRPEVGPWERFTLRLGASTNMTSHNVTVWDCRNRHIFPDFQLALAPLGSNHDHLLRHTVRHHGVNCITIGEAVTKATVDTFPADFLFNISRIKQRRLHALQSALTPSAPIYLSQFFSSIEHPSDVLATYKNHVFLQGVPHGTINNGSPCIVIANNNDCARRRDSDEWSATLSANPHCLFVVWDFDNHHWLRNSFYAALYSDIYIPSHSANFSLLQQLSTRPLTIVPCSTGQFRLRQIDDFLKAKTLSIQTRKKVSGLHRFYQQFGLRNSMIERMAAHCPDDVGFTPENRYDSRQHESNFAAWTSFAISFISPVNDDVPIRFFDSLMSGGLPLVPYTLQSHLDALNIPPNFYSVYLLHELYDSPALVIDRAYAHFLAQGERGVRARASYAARHHHRTHSLRAILDQVFHLLAKSENC
jgi:hypothetical protein